MNHNQVAELRRTETPAGVMTTLGSPTQGSRHLALWRVEMEAGAEGPVHVFDTEQIWTVISGRVEIRGEGGSRIELVPGDAAILEPREERQVRATEDSVMIVSGHGDAVAGVPGEPRPRGVPPWIA